jgi:hypothetical protein
MVQPQFARAWIYSQHGARHQFSYDCQFAEQAAYFWKFPKLTHMQCENMLVNSNESVNCCSWAKYAAMVMQVRFLACVFPTAHKGKVSR